MANLATDVVKMGSFTGKPKKLSASERKAGATVNVVDIVSEEKRLDLSSRETWAVKRHKSILSTQDKQLKELVQIGQVIKDVRSLYKSDNEFKAEVAKREIGKIPYDGSYGRYILMSLADLWSEIEPKLGTTGYTSKNPETLVKTLKAEKRKAGQQTNKRPSKKKSSGKKTDAKKELTKAQVLQMLQGAVAQGLIVKDDLKAINWTVTKK